MTTETLNVRNVFWEAAKRQGPALACAITVGAVVVVLFHAPLAPVIVGCTLALSALFARTWVKLKSS
jgi:hypothetical protein